MTKDKNNLYTNYTTERLTRKEKESNDFRWYKDKLDLYDIEGGQGNNNTLFSDGVSEYKRMKVNYDLYNNILNKADFSYVCQPFGAHVGELPAQMVNRDISSYRIKSLQGMEMKRSFGYKILATNSEATTRKEEEESGRLREYVISQIMAPIQQEIELKYQEQLQGELTPQQRQEIQEQIQSEIKSQTPDQIRKYMQRDHQDPAEVQGQQILNYITKEQDVKRKFNSGWKHGLLSAYEIYWIGIVNGKPKLKVINPLRFNCDKSPDLEFIEDGYWASCEYRMHPNEVVSMFDLTDDEIDKVYLNHHNYISQTYADRMFNDFNVYEDENDLNTIRVLHINWKGLRRIGWLDYVDIDGNLQTKFMVDESYKLNKDNGDIRIIWEWIPETYEGYKIGTDIYKIMQPVEGQFKDLEDIYNCKLSYYGAIYDNMNSQPTSVMDRMKVYQYLYNIILYRLELLIASDEGKKVLMNINAIPESAGMDIEKWQYFFKSSPFMWFDPKEEGMNQADVNTVAKTLDLSLASDIGKYIELATYLKQQCGEAVGINDSVLGQTAVSERVGNNQQNLVQTSHILEPYFDLHNSVKKNVLGGLLSMAKVAYVASDFKCITYVLDDMSVEMLNLDLNLLSNSTLGLFIEDSAVGEETKQTIQQLAHAAMQNQKIELSDMLKMLRQDSIQEAEETLIAAEQMRIEREQEQQEQQNKFLADEAQKVRDDEEVQHEREKELIVLKEEEKRKTVTLTQTILSVGFNEDKDIDNDGVLDVLEIANNGVDAQIKLSKEARENMLAQHKVSNDKIENKLREQEIKQKIKTK